MQNAKVSKTTTATLVGSGKSKVRTTRITRRGHNRSTKMTAPRDVSATIYFLQRDEAWQHIKSYNLEFESDVLASSNIKTQKVEDIFVKDLRGIEHGFTFERNGFAILEVESIMAYEDFNDLDKIERIYCQEVGQCLLQYMQAGSVQIFDVQIRRQHPSFPKSTIDPSIVNQPAVRAHVDTTPEAIRAIIQSLNGEEADKLLRNRYIYVNIWRPLKGPVQDWPLALCDAESVDTRNDLLPHDVIYEKGVRENMLLQFNPNQRWYYLSNQTPCELLVFRQADSDLSTAVPHASFTHTQATQFENYRRESIEVRAIVYL